MNNNPLAVTWSSGTNVSNLNEGNVIQTPPYTLSLNQWQQIVIRKEDKQVDIFIDGILVTTAQLSEGAIAWPLTSEKKFSLAKSMGHPDMYNSNYQGLLDDIAIWNEALTDDEINQLYGGLPNNTIQSLTITAYDKAGNEGSSKVDFFINKCN
ncbi:LamG domain-containing protein [Colwellia sp. MSW7]|uniref:LamG domain-containing protein n=1 Tax=Colwellia maritima TaxID=2912588 RepID=A0ABS9WWC0_9GAMM|nr:LamG domain-containing protein [Colwellia maritima]MCI2282238.1 LamG domain-containing protein [Colwellia maritima]